MQIYVAGPLFNTHERWYLERITEALEGAGYRTFLPHRDGGLLEGLTVEERQKQIFDVDVAALDSSDVCVALLTGQDQDSGTCIELGYMYAHGKPCFGITDDMRAKVNNMVWGVCQEGKRIVPSIEQLLELLRTELGEQPGL
jgi:nucleoside 2-deoxyribosyltransferase